MFGRARRCFAKDETHEDPFHGKVKVTDGLAEVGPKLAEDWILRCHFLICKYL